MNTYDAVQHERRKILSVLPFRNQFGTISLSCMQGGTEETALQPVAEFNLLHDFSNSRESVPLRWRICRLHRSNVSAMLCGAGTRDTLSRNMLLVPKKQPIPIWHGLYYFFRLFKLPTKRLEAKQKSARWLRHNVVQIRCFLPCHLFLPTGAGLTTRKTKDFECTSMLQPVWHHLVELHARRNRRDCIVTSGIVQFTALFSHSSWHTLDWTGTMQEVLTTHKDGHGSAPSKGLLQHRAKYKMYKMYEMSEI